MTSRVSSGSLVWPQQQIQNEVDQVQKIVGHLLSKRKIKDGIDLPMLQFGGKELPLTGVANQLTLTVFQTESPEKLDQIIKLFELDDALETVGGKESFLKAIKGVDSSLASMVSLYQLQRIDLEGVELLDPLFTPMNAIYRMNLDKFENIPDGSKPLYLARMEIEELPEVEFHPESVGGIRQMNEEQLNIQLPRLPGHAIKVLSKQQLTKIDFGRFRKSTLSDILSLRFSPLSDEQRALVKEKLYSNGHQEEKKV